MSRDATATARRAGGSLLVIALGMIGVLVVGMWAAWNWFDNPFGVDTIDRSPPPVLKEIRDLSEYHAAEGSFETIIDLEKDVRFVPSILAGQKVLFIGVGTVDAFVDLGGLTESAIDVDEEANSIEVRLPRAELDDVVIDHELSRVYDRDRGLFDRLGSMFVDNPSSEDELFEGAVAKIEEAALATSLLETAEENTAEMITGMLSLAGYDTVTVEFTDP